VRTVSRGGTVMPPQRRSFSWKARLGERHGEFRRHVTGVMGALVGAWITFGVQD
jgi:hypothetical protein